MRTVLIAALLVTLAAGPLRGTRATGDQDSRGTRPADDQDPRGTRPADDQKPPGIRPTGEQAPATVLDGVYTSAQAERGHVAYETHCIGCHEGQEADGPELTGKVFLDRWREDRLEPLFTFIRTTMPGNRPGSLDDRTYADIIAFILDGNGLPAGPRELTPDLASRIQLVGVDGPQPLANLTIVRTVGCLSASAGNTWALTRAAGPRPVRDRIVDGTTSEELRLSATQPPGAQTFPLMSVAERGPLLTGQKVQVKGVLTRQGPVERINVMSLESVAPRCD